MAKRTQMTMVAALIPTTCHSPGIHERCLKKFFLLNDDLFESLTRPDCSVDRIKHRDPENWWKGVTHILAIFSLWGKSCPANKNALKNRRTNQKKGKPPKKRRTLGCTWSVGRRWAFGRRGRSWRPPWARRACGSCSASSDHDCGEEEEGGVEDHDYGDDGNGNNKHAEVFGTLRINIF